MMLLSVWPGANFYNYIYFLALMIWDGLGVPSWILETDASTLKQIKTKNHMSNREPNPRNPCTDTQTNPSHKLTWATASSIQQTHAPTLKQIQATSPHEQPGAECDGPMSWHTNKSKPKAHMSNREPNPTNSRTETQTNQSHKLT